MNSDDYFSLNFLKEQHDELFTLSYDVLIVLGVIFNETSKRKVNARTLKCGIKLHIFCTITGPKYIYLFFFLA